MGKGCGFRKFIRSSGLKRVDNIKCPSDCMGGSHIYHKLKTNEYFIFFASGRYIDSNELTKLFAAMIFINTVLLGYIGKGYQLIIGGHSAGSVNAIYIARVISMLDEQFLMMINTLPNCKDQLYKSPQRPWYNDFDALCSDTRQVFVDKFQNASNDIYLEGGRRANPKYLLEQVIKCFEVVQKYRPELSNIVFITSGGHPSIEGIIPWAQTEKFFSHRIINFGVMSYKHEAVASLIRDILITYNIPTSTQIYSTIPIVGLFNDSKTDELRWIDDPIKFVMTQSEVTPEKAAHDFKVYREIIVKLLKDPEQMARFTSYLFK